MASMGVYVFTRRVLLDMLEHEPGHDFGRSLIPNALGRYKVKPYLFRGYWADVGTIESFYQANIMLGRLDSPFHFWDRERPIYTHLRQLPGSLMPEAHVRDSLVSEGCYLAGCEIDGSIVGVRMRVREGSPHHAVGPARRRLLRVRPARRPHARAGHRAQRHPGSRDRRQERTHRRRRAPGQRTEARVADGDGFYIRSGIIVVPKGGVIRPGTVV